MVLQNAVNQRIVGGVIDSTPIGGTTPNTGVFTTLTSNTATIGGSTRSVVIKSATDPGNGSVQATFLVPGGSQGSGGRLYFGESGNAYFSLNFSNISTLEGVPNFQIGIDPVTLGADASLAIYRSGSKIRYQASGSSNGHDFYTVPAGTFQSFSGQTLAFSIATTGQIQAKANISSTSTTTGGAVVDFGLGVGGNANIGGYLAAPNIFVGGNTGPQLDNSSGTVRVRTNAGAGDAPLSASTVTVSTAVAFTGGAAPTTRTNLKVPASDNTGITGADEISNLVSLTQAEYDAIGTKNAATLYFITT
jgi:cytoskeletal protein CcmA (bactofilin family)